MSTDADVYNATIALFGSEPDPAFEDRARLSRLWGREWGCDNDVGRLRVVLMHRPGEEFGVIDPHKRLPDIGSYGDLEAGWYWQSREIPMMEGGSFAWLTPTTAVVGRGIRVNDEAIAQVADVLRVQGVELLVVDLCGYDIHIDGALVMLDTDLALIDPHGLPHSFLQELSKRGIRCIELGPEDNGWIVNSLAVAPGRVLMPEGLSARTAERLDREGVQVITVPYDAMQLNGGGIHCSTCPLLRDPV